MEPLGKVALLCQQLGGYGPQNLLFLLLFCPPKTPVPFSISQNVLLPACPPEFPVLSFYSLESPIPPICLSTAAFPAQGEAAFELLSLDIPSLTLVLLSVLPCLGAGLWVWAGEAEDAGA